MGEKRIRELTVSAAVVGSGAAGYNAVHRLRQYGVNDAVLITENQNAGTSRNAGSDKQTYYKLSLSGSQDDSVRRLAGVLYDGDVWTEITLCAKRPCRRRAFLSCLNLAFHFRTAGTGNLLDIRRITTQMIEGQAQALILRGI